ncbi:spore coat protein [Oceanobacillus bengalensis]|uniref:spore coat protein n=1 Tax=Oceanobacillus bengalensis TaxID=1435466 RepID=UPI001FEC69E9|nr:spore coat protein [Oceanobacillus bengalensis]
MTVYRSANSTKERANYLYFNDDCNANKNDCLGSQNQEDNYNLLSNNDATIAQGDGEYSFLEQESAELIWVKESCNITVTSNDTQASVSLQAALQLAIAIVISITIADSDRSDHVSQELLQYTNTEQINRQKIYIYNTKDATVTTTDTDIAVNIQLLLQVLLTLVLLLDIL